MVSRRVFWHSVFEGRQVLNVLVVQPLDLKVQVHVVSSLTELMLLMFCKKTTATTAKVNTGLKSLSVRILIND